MWTSVYKTIWIPESNLFGRHTESASKNLETGVKSNLNDGFQEKLGNGYRRSKKYPHQSPTYGGLVAEVFQNFTLVGNRSPNITSPSMIGLSHCFPIHTCRKSGFMMRLLHLPTVMQNLLDFKPPYVTCVTSSMTRQCLLP